MQLQLDVNKMFKEEKDETSCISSLAMGNETNPAVLQTPTGE